MEGTIWRFQIAASFSFSANSRLLITQKMKPKEAHSIRNQMARIDENKGEEKPDNVGKKMVDGDGKVHPETIRPSNLGIGLVTIPIQGPINENKDKIDNMGKRGDEDGKVHSEPINPSNLGIGLVTIPIQGPDGGFHLQLGPFGLGFDLGGGGVVQLPPGVSPDPYPGQPMPVPYTPPYVLVSRYQQPYGRPTQYPYMTPSQQIGLSPPAHGSYDHSPPQEYNPQGSLQKESFGSPGTSN